MLSVCTQDLANMHGFFVHTTCSQLHNGLANWKCTTLASGGPLGVDAGDQIYVTLFFQ